MNGFAPLLSLAVVALALHSALLAAADPCNPTLIPSGFQRNSPLTPVIVQYPGQPQVETQLSGFVDYVDGCNLIIRNFTYLPDVGATKLYGIKAKSENDTNAWPVSSTPVTTADGHRDATFKLDKNKNLNDFNYIKLFSEQQKVLVAWAKLYDLPDAAGSSTAAATGKSGAAATAGYGWASASMAVLATLVAAAFFA